MSALAIGVIADTHGLLADDALRALEGSDAILHAGDVGGEDLLAALRALAPVVAVVGNGDPDLLRRYPWEQRVELGGARILLCHWYDNFGRIHPAVARELEVWNPDALVYGHTHEEIADLLGLVSGTVRAHYHRARQALKGRLALEDNDD